MKLATYYLTDPIVSNFIVLHIQVGGYSSDVGFCHCGVFDCRNTFNLFYSSTHTLEHLPDSDLLSKHIWQILYDHQAIQLQCVVEFHYKMSMFNFIFR